MEIAFIIFTVVFFSVYFVYHFYKLFSYKPGDELSKYKNKEFEYEGKLFTWSEVDILYKYYKSECLAKKIEYTGYIKEVFNTEFDYVVDVELRYNKLKLYFSDGLKGEMTFYQKNEDGESVYDPKIKYDCKYTEENGVRQYIHNPKVVAILKVFCNNDVEELLDPILNSYFRLIDEREFYLKARQEIDIKIHFRM